MKAKAKTHCSECNSTSHLVEHHVSYIPEITKPLCRKCDAKYRRQPISRGLPILKAHPSRGLIFFPKNLLHQFGDLLELEVAPVSPVGIIFPYGMPLTDVDALLNLISESLHLRIRKEGGFLNDNAKR